MHIALGSAEPSYDLMIVCAVDEELKAVKDAARSVWRAVPVTSSDTYPYEAATIARQGGPPLRVVAAVAPQMGMTSSAVLATKMILRFRPRLVAMVGVAGGVHQAGRDLGDILVPDVTFDYESGKITRLNTETGTTVKFEPSPSPLDVDSNLIQRIRSYATRGVLDDISRRYGGTSSTKQLKLHVGPIGSGGVVVNDAEKVEGVKSFSRKLIGVEMELYAVHRACKLAIRPSPLFFGIKSIMDFAQNKNDAQKHYAAYTAAEFFFRFVRQEWESLPLPESRSEKHATQAYLNDVINAGVESLHAVLPKTTINGRYFTLDSHEGKPILRRVSHLHVERSMMPGEEAAVFFYLDEGLGICQAFNERQPCLKKLLPPGEMAYPERIANQIDPEQKWALCAPVLRNGEAVGVLCYFSREDIDCSTDTERKVKPIVVAHARVFASALALTSE
jgi:nucleoside phosphorylase